LNISLVLTGVVVLGVLSNWLAWRWSGLKGGGAVGEAPALVE